jgi:hypothetical protein
LHPCRRKFIGERHGIPYYALPYAITVGCGFGAAAIRPPPPRCGGTAPWSASAVFKLMPTLKPADRDLPKNGER